VAALALGGFPAFSPMMKTRDGTSPVWSTYAFAQWETESAHAWHEVRDLISGGRILMANGTELPQVVRPIGLVDRWLEMADPDMIVPDLVPVAAVDDWRWIAGRIVRLPIVDLFGRVVRVELRGRVDRAAGEAADGQKTMRAAAAGRRRRVDAAASISAAPQQAPGDRVRLGRAAAVSPGAGSVAAGQSDIRRDAGSHWCGRVSPALFPLLEEERE
jgi:hypothetical protein